MSGEIEKREKREIIISKKERNIYEALLEAQKKIGSAKKTTSNPYYNSKYADYSSIMQSVKKEMLEEGILIAQSLTRNSEYDEMVILTELILVNDPIQRISDTTPVILREKNNPQALGSAITYARRYGLQTLACIETENDHAHVALSGKIVEEVFDQAKIEEIIQKIEEIENLEDLKNFYSKIGKYKTISEIIKAKDIKKKGLLCV